MANVVLFNRKDAWKVADGDDDHKRKARVAWIELFMFCKACLARLPGAKPNRDGTPPLVCRYSNVGPKVSGLHFGWKPSADLTSLPRRSSEANTSGRVIVRRNDMKGQRWFKDEQGSSPANRVVGFEMLNVRACMVEQIVADGEADAVDR